LLPEVADLQEESFRASDGEIQRSHFAAAGQAQGAPAAALPQAVGQSASVARMGRIEARLEELELSLPAPMDPPGNFKLVNVHEGIAYIAGHPAIDGSSLLAQGAVGRDLTLEEGYQAARLAGLSIVASLKKELGELDRITRWLRAVGYVQSSPEFHDNAKVVNGFSDLIVEIWGEDGRHARSAPGQGPSPLNVPIIVDAIVAVSQSASAP
jgi:enamine deaminase RidA (YjgF/YER057c/UK114 family)